MSIYNLATTSNDVLKKLVRELVSLEDVYDKCEDCGRLILFHKEAECRRDVEEGLEVIAKNWRDLKRRLKPILKEIKEVKMRESEQNVYLDGIEHIAKQIQL